MRRYFRLVHTEREKEAVRDKNWEAMLIYHGTSQRSRLSERGKQLRFAVRNESCRTEENVIA